MSEPNEADKAAAEAIAASLGWNCVSVGSVTPDSMWLRHTFEARSEATAGLSNIIAQHMAPERQAAAELREENASLKESLSYMPALYYACELTVSAVTGLSRARPSDPVHAVIWDQLKDAMDHARAAIIGMSADGFRSAKRGGSVVGQAVTSHVQDSRAEHPEEIKKLDAE